jgi:hypothetical protein
MVIFDAGVVEYEPKDIQRFLFRAIFGMEERCPRHPTRGCQMHGLFALFVAGLVLGVWRFFAFSSEKGRK